MFVEDTYQIFFWTSPFAFQNLTPYSNLDRLDITDEYQ